MVTNIKQDFISQLGLAGLAFEKQTELLSRMAAIIQKKIALRVVKLLPEQALDEYLKIVDNSEIGGQEFLTKKIPNYSLIIEEEIANFKKEIVN